MKKTDCVIYDCEFNYYLKGIIKDNIVYVIDDEGKEALPKDHVCEYVDYDRVQFYIGYFSEGEDELDKINSRWGYFQLSTGRVIVSPIYDYACPFYGNRAKVMKNGKCGFIDPNGRVVVDIVWDEAGSVFRDYLCWVKKDDKIGFISENGIEIFPPQFEMVKRYQCVENKEDGRKYIALVKKHGKYGYIDGKGNYIFEPSFEDGKDFSRIGYAPVRSNGKWGFIDKKGTLVVDYQFDDVGQYKQLFIEENKTIPRTLFGNEIVSFYTVKKYDQWALLDSDLNVIMPEEEVDYVLHSNRKVYIEDGEVTSVKKLI